MAIERILTRGFFGALVLAAVSACTSSSEPTEDGIPFEGFWRLTIDVTVATGICAGEEDDPIEVTDALITEEAGVVTATGIWSSESGSVSLTGDRSGNTIRFGGSYAEDGGTTSTLYTLTVAEGSLTGTEFWTWNGPDGSSCPGSQSTVTGVPR